MFSGQKTKHLQNACLLIACLLVGFLGGQLSTAICPLKKLSCQELSVVDDGGSPVIKLVSTKAGPQIELVGKDGVQSLSMRVIDTPYSGDNRMSQISFRHSGIEEDQITLGALRDKSSNMSLGSHDSSGSIYMSAAPYGVNPSSNMTIGYFSGPRVDCLANDSRVELTIGQGKTCVRAEKLNNRIPTLEIKDGEKKYSIGH